MESRKMMRNVSGGIESTGQFKHGRGRHAQGLMFLQHLIIWHDWKWGLWWEMARDKNIWEGYKMIMKHSSLPHTSMFS